MGWQDRAYNRDGGGVPPVNFALPPLTPLVWTLLGVNLGLFLLKISEGLFFRVALWMSLSLHAPFGQWWQVWRLITYQYVHGNALQLFFSLLGIFFFVPPLERRWGWRKAYGFYTLGGVFAGLCFVAIGLFFPVTVLAGAEGAIFAALGAVALFYPETQLILLIFFVPIRAAAAIFGGLFLLMVVADHSYPEIAKLGGLAFGFCGPWLIGPVLVGQQQRLRQWQTQRSRNAEINEQQEIDRILAKVGQSGMNSLSGGEKRTLARASVNQRKRDGARRR